MSTKKNDVLTLLDKAVGKKGPLRIPSYWMREVLLKIMDWAEGLSPKINIPTKISQFENDAEYATNDYVNNLIPTKISQFENDAEYATRYYVNNRINNLESELNLGNYVIMENTGDEAIQIYPSTTIESGQRRKLIVGSEFPRPYNISN